MIQNNTNKPVPLLSIGMPVYNGQSLLEKAIEALLSQTFKNYELIISDNGSTDSTEEICKEFSSKDKRITYIRQTVNRGAAFNFRYVLNQARGKYFMWAAHDDERLLHHIEKLMEIHEKGDYILVASQCKMFDNHGRVIPFKSFPDGYFNGSRWRSFKNYLFLHHSDYAKANLIYGIFRREILITIPIFPKWYPTIGSDHIVLLNAITRGKIHFLSEITWVRQKELPKKLKLEDYNGNCIEFTKERIKHKLKIINEICNYTLTVNRIIMEKWNGHKKTILLLLSLINFFRIMFLHLYYNPFSVINKIVRRID